MKIAAILVSELTTVLSDRRSLWWHGLVLAFGPVLLLLLWPAENLAFYLNRGQGPGTLVMLGVTAGISMALLSGAFAMDQIPRKPGYTFVHWYRYTPAGPLSYMAGRLLFHIVHSGLLTLMLLPSLAVAAIPSRARPGEILGLAGFILFSSFCFRAAAEAGRSTYRNTGSSAYLSFFLLFIAFMIATYSGLPGWSPVTVLQVLSDPARSDGWMILKNILSLLVVAMAGSGLALRRLYQAVHVEEAGSIS